MRREGASKESTHRMVIVHPEFVWFPSLRLPSWGLSRIHQCQLLWALLDVPNPTRRAIHFTGIVVFWQVSANVLIPPSGTGDPRHPERCPPVGRPGSGRLSRRSSERRRMDCVRFGSLSGASAGAYLPPRPPRRDGERGCGSWSAGGGTNDPAVRFVAQAPRRERRRSPSDALRPPEAWR